MIASARCNVVACWRATSCDEEEEREEKEKEKEGELGLLRLLHRLHQWERKCQEKLHAAVCGKRGRGGEGGERGSYCCSVVAVAARWRVMVSSRRRLLHLAAASVQHFPISHCTAPHRVASRRIAYCNFSHDYVALTLAYATSTGRCNAAPNGNCKSYDGRHRHRQRQRQRAAPCARSTTPCTYSPPPHPSSPSSTSPHSNVA